MYTVLSNSLCRSIYCSVMRKVHLYVKRQNAPKIIWRPACAHCPDPLESLQCSPDPLAGFRTDAGGKGRDRSRKARGRSLLQLTRNNSFTCYSHVYPQVERAMFAFTPQPQSITALWLVLISRPAESRRLSLSGRIVSYCIVSCAAMRT